MENGTNNPFLALITCTSRCLNLSVITDVLLLVFRIESKNILEKEQEPDSL